MGNNLYNISFDDKIHNLVDMISEYDEEFKTLAKYDVEECTDRIKYFIQDEHNLDILNISTFNSLIEQIEDFYRENGEFESLICLLYTSPSPRD